jgi:Fibronectin type III domain
VIGRRTLASALAALLTASALALLPARPAAAAPAQLPSDRLHFGLASGPDQLTWMTASGVPWRYRYTYLAGGLYNNPWPTWQDPALPPGQYALDYMNSSWANGYIPVFPYYMLLQSHRTAGASESQDDFTNLNDSALMRDYYVNFTLLMQKSAQYGHQVVVHVEPDLWGYLQQISGNTTPAAVTASVASSGDADVAGFGNTVQGFGQALLHLRDLYAPNVVMAVHASLWSSGPDVATSTDPLLDAAAEADKTAAFLAATGGWDAVFNDVDDHDAGWWEATQGWPGHWWDRTNTTLPNFSRYLQWVAELHSRMGRPVVAWQVPAGNQHYLTENNTPGHYQDNVAEYFLGHTADLYAAGLVAVLFGAGNADQSTPYDTMGDGVTNNAGIPTSDAAGACAACNTALSGYSDDDGGYLRVFVGLYYTIPTAVSAAAGDGSARVSWTPPSTASLPILHFTVTAHGTPGAAAVAVPGSVTSAVVPGLADGSPYTFTVSVTTANGTGADSAPSNPVTPAGRVPAGQASPGAPPSRLGPGEAPAPSPSPRLSPGPAVATAPASISAPAVAPSATSQPAPSRPPEAAAIWRDLVWDGRRAGFVA